MVSVEVVAGIASIVVVVAVGVVMRVHRVGLMTGRRHRRTETVVVVAVVARTVVVARARAYVDDHPGLVAGSVPAEADRFKVFEGGEAEQLIAHLVVRHDHEGVTPADAVSRDVNGDSLDAARANLDTLFGVVVAFVRVEVQVNAAFVGVVANVLHVVVDSDGVGVVDHHGLRH
jgi:hypothetical protein